MTNSENPFVLLARITVKEGMVDEYLEIAEAADKAVEETEEGMLFHNFDSDPLNPLKFTWSEVYEDSEALLFHLNAPYIPEYVGAHDRLADSFEIEIYGNISKEAFEAVTALGFPFKHFKSTRVGYTRDNILTNKRKDNIGKAQKFLDTAFTDPDEARSLLHENFSSAIFLPFSPNLVRRFLSSINFLRFFVISNWLFASHISPVSPSRMASFMPPSSLPIDATP